MREKYERSLVDKIHTICKDSYSDYGKLLRIRSLLKTGKKKK